MSPERRLRRVSLAIAILGLAAAALIAATAPEGENSEAGVQVAGLANSRAYRRDIERAGGWAAVAAVELREWIASLGTGRRLAATVGTLSLVAAAGCWVAARRTPDRPPAGD